ncbi:MAG: hypothetical protein GY714_03640 [Desulfobacterales bacterium]|nr:hypothetical protein [Desulfobacterales bacterium]
MIGLSSFCHYYESPTSYFSDYSEAKASGIMKRGWVPTFIPNSSTEIKETHNIDARTVDMTFRYSSGDSKDVHSNCKIVKTTDFLTKYKCSYSGNDVFIELYSDGSGKLESYPKQ